MKLYDVKTRDRFVRWLRDKQEGIRTNFLDGMNGGQKANFLKQHREMIMDLVEIRGADWVIQEFQLSELTFYWFIHGGQDRMFEYQNKHKANGKWVNREILHNLFDEIDKINRRLDDMAHQIDMNNTRLQLNDAKYDDVKAQQRQVTDDIRQFSDNTAKLISTALLQPMIQRTIQPALDSVHPLKKPDLTLTKMIKVTDQTRKQITAKATNLERISLSQPEQKHKRVALEP